MNLNYKAAIKTALASIINSGIPVEFMNYTGKEKPTYITFFCYNEQTERYAENLETKTGYYVQIDIYSKTNPDATAALVKTAMKAAGFVGYEAQDLFENDTNLYHKAISMNITH